MNPAQTQLKSRPEDTRARIMDTAEALFRRLGYEKTAVADIASELGMSPANIYRFFPSKIAIVQAMCQRCLSELETKLWAVARSRAPAGERLLRLVLEALAYHKENLLEEQKVNDIVLVAMEESWDAIRKHKEVHRTAVELILRDGIEFRRVRAGRSARDVDHDHARASGLLPPDPARPGPAGGQQPRSRGGNPHPPPAPRHHRTKVASHDQAVLRIIAFKE